MSTFAGESQSSVLKSEEDLLFYFQRFAKPRSCMRVGLEAEFFGVHKATGKALPYEGAPGIHQILKELAARFGYDPVVEAGAIIALKRDQTLISLEPGGQVELSAPPVFTVFEIEEQVRDFLNQLRAMRAKFPGIEWLAAGIQPFSSLEDMNWWVPKARYGIMAAHLGARGSLAHHMMKRTATNQINFDYLSEENAMECLRVALGITSIVSAMFANSSFSEGRPNGFMSKRLDIWAHTDPERTGLIEEFLKPGLGFKSYVEYLLTMPVMFIVRKGRWIPLGNLNFRDYIRQGFEGEPATLGDFELHLSTAFPEVRLKQYLEVRGVDCQSPDLIPPVAAFWKGILYDCKTRQEAWKLVSSASPRDFLQLHEDVARFGLQAKLGGKAILPIAEALVNLSCSSLGRQRPENEPHSECYFLNVIREKIIRPGKPPAQTLLEKWNDEFQHDPSRLIEYLSIG